MLLRKKTADHRSVVLTWFLSYISVLLLPVLISVFVYIGSRDTLESEIHQANISLLKQVREGMDNYFQAMERLNFELTWNLQVQELLTSNKYVSAPTEYTYDLYRITRDFLLYKSAYLLSVDFFYMYLPKSDSIVLPLTIRNADFAYEILHADPSFPYSEWKSILNRKNFKGFLPMVRIDDNGKVKKTAAYISTYSIDSDKPAATNVIMIDQSRVLGAIQNMELFNKGHVMILNKDNELLISNSKEAVPQDFPYDKLTAGGNFFYYVNNDEKYEVQTLQSDNSGLKYISMIPSSLYWEKAEHVRNLTYLSILVSLLGGGLLTYFFMRKNYNPVRRLVQTFSGKGNVSYGKGLNEFQFIELAFGSTLSKLDEIMDRMKSQQHILRSNFIARLIKGRMDTHIPLDESLTTFNMRFHSNDFAVILLYVESNAPFHERLESMESGDKQRLLQFIVSNVVEELAAQHNSGFVTEVDQAFACLINFRQIDQDDRRTDLMRITKEAQTFLSAHYHIHLTLSISSIHSGLHKISQAYLEALDAMEYKLVMGRKEILSYEEIYKAGTKDHDPAYYYPLQVEQQLINYMKIGDFYGSKETLDNIIGRNLNTPATVSVAIARCLMLDLVSTMMKTISEIGNVQESFLFQNPKRIEQLTACETIHDMQQQMTELLQQVCEYTSAKRQHNIQQSRQQALSELTERVKNYIYEYYHDASLNISMMGQHFEMKPSYLSKLFKDQTEEGLLDFLNKKRIARAKELIAESKRNIMDVSACVGFNDVRAFIRIFKKYEGITPGKYKEMLEE